MVKNMVAVIACLSVFGGCKPRGFNDGESSTKNIQGAPSGAVVYKKIECNLSYDSAPGNQGHGFCLVERPATETTGESNFLVVYKAGSAQNIAEYNIIAKTQVTLRPVPQEPYVDMSGYDCMEVHYIEQTKKQDFFLGVSCLGINGQEGRAKGKLSMCVDSHAKEDSRIQMCDIRSVKEIMNSRRQVADPKAAIQAIALKKNTR
jgi:hypothetical protein